MLNKLLTILLSVMFSALLTTGCDKRSMDLQNTATTTNTNTKMEQLSNSMDKLDKALNGLDDSSKIKEIESVINNN